MHIHAYCTFVSIVYHQMGCTLRRILMDIHKVCKMVPARKFLVSVFSLLPLFLFSPVHAQVSFQQVSGPFKSAVESWGASWGDINNDAYPDIFVNNHRDMPTFYLNRGNGSFSNNTSNVDLSRTWFDTPLLDQHGATWADFDNDGDQDLYITTGYAYDAQLMLNNGNGQLTNATDLYPGLSVDLEGRLGVWFDQNNDGQMDLALANGATNYFYNQSVSGAFSKQTSTANFVSDLTTFGVLWDVDRDNTLDLVMVNDGPFPEVAYSTSTLPFSDLTHEIPVVSSVVDVVQGDFDGDLHNDVYLVRGNLRHRQVKKISNTRVEARMQTDAGAGDRGFEFTTAGIVTLTIDSTQYSSAFLVRSGSNGVRLEDLDGDKENRITTITLDPADPALHGTMPHENVLGTFVGYNPATQTWSVDISAGAAGTKPPSTRAYLIAESTQTIAAVATNSVGGADRAIDGVLLLNTDSGIQEKSVESNLDSRVSCVSGAAADFDNDMDMDIYLVCRGGVENISNIIFENNGDGSFTKHATAWGASSAIGTGLNSQTGTGESVVIADYDVDGFVDLYVTNGLNMRPFRVGGPNHLFKNMGNANKWIEFDLQGTQSTRDAVGARVIVTAGGVDQLREQNGGYHRWAQNDRRLHFGLKNNSSVSVTVYWPSGLVSSFDNIAANKLYRVVEGSGITVVQPGVKIRNHEDVPVMSLSDVTVNEEEATATLMVSLSAASTRTVVGNFSTENLSASAGEDYFATNGSIEFPAGQVDALITIDLIGDSLSEGDESFEVRMNTVSNAVIGNGTSEVTIVDNEGGTPALLPSMFIDNVLVDEHAGTAEFTVSLSQASASIVQVNYITQDGTAQSGSDYAAQTGVLTFNAGQLSQIISISVKDDAETEGEEIFQVILSGVTNALLGDAEGTGVITANDGSGLPEMSISDVTQEEAAGSMKFTVSLSESPTKTVNVNYTTLEETALSGSDYNTKTGTLTFKPGQKNKIVYVYVKNDTQSEGDETFRVLLSNATNALLVDEEAVGTILASDGGGVTAGLPEMSISDVTQEEAAGSMKFTVSLSESPTKTVNVNYTTLEETALSGADYNTKTGTLTFKPGQKNKIVYVYVKNDTQSEGDETFRVLLSNATNAVLVDEEAVGTILASDGGSGGTVSAVVCGKPAYTATGEQAVYFYKDCGTNRWHQRVTGGGGSKAFRGNIQSTHTLSGKVGFSIEANDTLTLSNKRVDYVMKVGAGGQDGVDFTLNVNAQTCVTQKAPLGGAIYVGKNRQRMGDRFVLETLANCQ